MIDWEGEKVCRTPAPTKAELAFFFSPSSASGRVEGRNSFSK
jgi:hypothetical protein